jgi:hypothetical protein
MAKPDAPYTDPENNPQNDPHDEAHDEAHDDPTFATTADDTTQLEQTMHSDQTEQLDTTEATSALATDQQSTNTDLFGNPVKSDDRSDDQEPAVAGTTTASEQPDWPPVLPERPSGPHAPAIVLGLVCLAVAGIILAQELGDLTVDWGDIGPFGIVVTGAVLVLFGLVGLLTSRRNSKTS